MRAIEQASRSTRIKPATATQREHCAAHSLKNRDNRRYRLSRLLHQATGRAKRRGLDCDLTLEWLLANFPADAKCPVLGTELQFNSAGKGIRESSPSLDRVDNTAGYTTANVRIISLRANRIKSDASLAELAAVHAYMKAST